MFDFYILKGVIPLQSKNALSPISVTVSGSERKVSRWQPVNAPLLTRAHVLGSVREVSPLQNEARGCQSLCCHGDDSSC